MTTCPSLVLEPPAFLADPGLGAVLDALPEARIVGGAVRDAVAGRPVADVDLATPRAPDDVTRALEAAGLRAVPTGEDHGTVTALSGHRGFEITTLRRDVLSDGRHAVVAFTDDWRVDAARRDFTFNAMSMSRAGEIYDYFGGIADLHGGIVRFVGEAATRLAEDYLRALRFFRFYARYATAEPDAATQSALADAVPGLARLSAERVWSELKRILATPNVDPALALMHRLGVLAAVLPECAAPVRSLDALPADALLRLAALAPRNADLLAARLRLAVAERQRLADLLEPSVDEAADDACLRRALADTPADILIGRARIAGASGQLVDRIGAMPMPVFPLQGRDLLAAGIPAGPRVGALLRELRGVWMASGCTLSEEDLRAELAARRPR